MDLWLVDLGYFLVREYRGSSEWEADPLSIL